MTKGVLFFSCVAIVLVSLGASGAWSLHVYAATVPEGISSVLGTSTDSNITKSTQLPELTKLPVVAPGLLPQINSKEYALYNPDSGRFIVTSKAMSPVPIASTTKLMTDLLVTKFGKLDDIVATPEEAATIEGSVMHLQTGDTLTVQNLLYGSLTVSANDATRTLAGYIGGILLHNPNAPLQDRLARFVVEMNATATKLHMENTHYIEPVGLEDGTQSTAMDLAKLLAIDNQVPILKTIFGTSSTTVTDVTGKKTYQLTNTNQLETTLAYPGNTGGKTGYTPAAGRCLVDGATRNGVQYIAVVLNTTDTALDANAIEARKLLDYAFTNVTWR